MRAAHSTVTALAASARMEKPATRLMLKTSITSAISPYSLRISATRVFFVISIFFFWGFVAASNDILIPVFKKALNLSQFESQLISFAFYVAYTVGSILYFAISALLKKDILNKIGYRNGLALGLIISAVGTLLFIPASNNASFIMLISVLFIVGLGFALQQIAANPLAIQMGDPSKGNIRLSMAGGINNVGTTIGPVIVSFAIFIILYFFLTV